MRNLRHNSRIGTLKDQCICGLFKQLGYNFGCFVGVQNVMLARRIFSAFSSVSLANMLLAMVLKQQKSWCLFVHATCAASLH
jgi:hypothetical protein